MDGVKRELLSLLSDRLAIDLVTRDLANVVTVRFLKWLNTVFEFLSAPFLHRYYLR